MLSPKNKPSPTERILADARRPPSNSAAIKYAKNVRRFARRAAVAVRGLRCELAAVQLAKELIGSVADPAEISRADRVRALERTLRDSCFIARPRAKPRSK